MIQVINVFTRSYNLMKNDFQNPVDILITRIFMSVCIPQVVFFFKAKYANNYAIMKNELNATRGHTVARKIRGFGISGSPHLLALASKGH